ncbi:MAG: Panacea domain-containing protein [Methylocella sp.]
MPLGPVNSTTYRFINGEMEDQNWSEFLRDRSNHELSVTQAGSQSDWDELSDADIECLDRTWSRFGHMQPFELVNWTHDPANIPEWENPEGSSYLIPIRRILKMLMVANAEEHSKVVEDHRKITRLLESITD